MHMRGTVQSEVVVLELDQARAGSYRPNLEDHLFDSLRFLAVLMSALPKEGAGIAAE